MTDEVQTTRYRNLESYPVYLDGAPQVEAFGFTDLSDEQVEANQATIREHFSKVLEPEKEDTPTFDRKAAMERAKELGLTGYSTLRNDELQTAIIQAEEQQKEGDQS